MVALMFACDNPGFYFKPHEQNYIKMINILDGVEAKGGRLGKKATKLKAQVVENAPRPMPEAPVVSYA